MGKLVLLPHAGDAHVHMQPVNLLRPQVAEAEPIASYVLHSVAVHYLLDDALEHIPQKEQLRNKKSREQWHTPVILAAWEAEAGGLCVQSQLQQLIEVLRNSVRSCL